MSGISALHKRCDRPSAGSTTFSACNATTRRGWNGTIAEAAAGEFVCNMAMQ